MSRVFTPEDRAKASAALKEKWAQNKDEMRKILSKSMKKSWKRRKKLNGTYSPRPYHRRLNVARIPNGDGTPRDVVVIAQELVELKKSYEARLKFLTAELHAALK